MSLPTATARIVTELDHVRLSSLLVRQPAPCAGLAELLDDANLVPTVEVPADVVTMNSRVQLADPSTGALREIALCYPADADPGAGRLSVLSPAGAGLLGLRVGANVQWRGADGQPVAAELRAMLYQPEASGDLLR